MFMETIVANQRALFNLGKAKGKFSVFSQQQVLPPPIPSIAHSPFRTALLSCIPSPVRAESNSERDGITGTLLRSVIGH